MPLVRCPYMRFLVKISLYAKIGQNRHENRSKFALFFMERVNC